MRGHRAVTTNLAKLAALPAVSREDFSEDLVLRIVEAIEIDQVKLLRYRPEQSDLFLEAGVGWKEVLSAASASRPT